MEHGIIDFFLHFDRNLAALVEAYPRAIYALMFLIVFVETGLFLAMLPGDTLLFAAGALAASHGLFNFPLLIPLMAAAAFCGDQINYLLGRWVGERPFRRDGRFFNRRTLEQARRFYRSHGGKAVLMGRFVPVVRSATPMAAAIGGMPYRRFLAFSLPGSVAWTLLFLFLGHSIGNLEVVRGRFLWVMAAVLVATLLPGLVQYLVEKHHGKGSRRKHSLRMP
jgi:membrane-associated protein